MEIKVISEHEITEGLKTMIKVIMEQSQCPNESLINSIPGCKGIKDNIVTIGERVVNIETVRY